MRNLYPFFLRGLLCVCCSVPLFRPAIAQISPHSIATSSNSHGYYEYLPHGYTTGTGKYPLLFFLHGGGELGNGTTDLPLLLRYGPLQMITAGSWPDSFHVNDKTFQFIIFAPQFINPWPSNDQVDSAMQYALAHYRVDTSRVYVTGLSMGGNVAWQYVAGEAASKVSAVLPIAGGEIYNGMTGATAIANANLAVLTTTNVYDPVTPPTETIQDVNEINSIRPAINPTAIAVTFPDSGHDAWTHTYDLNLKLVNGLNVFQWMLQYSRGVDTTSTSPPVDPPLPVILTAFTATLVSTPVAGGPQDQVDLNWTTAQEQNNRYFLVERSPDGSHFITIDTIPAAANAAHGHTYSTVDERPMPGLDFYRLAQVDLDGKFNYSPVRKIMVTDDSHSGLQLSPNPATSTLYLDLGSGESGPIEVRLLDASGRPLRSWSWQKPDQNSWTQAVDVGGIPTGTYYIQLVSKQLQTVQAFIKK
jgi:acetyl esterase/lipase